MGYVIKKIGTNGVGDTLVECPVCEMPYLEQALNQHLAQMSGKEAQYEMARVVYKMIENNKQEFALGLSETLDLCPHWRYLLAHPPPKMRRPVELNPRYAK